MERSIAAAVIFPVSLLVVVIRPRRVNEGLVAAAGAVLMIAALVVPPLEALRTLAGEWNLFLFFLGMMLLAGMADLAGFFEAAGILAAAVAGGSGRRLLLSVFASGTLITTFLSNDATALILTPVVYAMVVRLRLPPLPFLFATTFAADTASMTLPISNPINVLVIERTGIHLGPYLAHLLAPSA
ncbi:MAG: SLC13 family permease, partial [Candidatus Dormibacteraceae bacterium]